MPSTKVPTFWSRLVRAVWAIQFVALAAAALAAAATAEPDATAAFVEANTAPVAAPEPKKAPTRIRKADLPAPCGTYQPLDIDAPDPDRPWRPGPSASVIRLGPGASDDAWVSDEKLGALLIMRDGDTHDGARYGFSKLDLWPLVGYARPRGTNFPPPPIEIGALQVGLALADA